MSALLRRYSFHFSAVLKRGEDPFSIERGHAAHAGTGHRLTVFMVGQVAEGNVLTPKLVGESVGLHPVWLILALTVFGALFGFVGMLVAVPLAAAIGVFVRFLAEKYTDSRLYKGLKADAHVETEE